MYSRGEIYEIHKIVWAYLSQNKGIFGYDNVDFDIEIEHKVRKGHSFTSLTIKFPVIQTDRERLESKKKYYEEQIAHINDDLKKCENSKNIDSEEDDD